MMTSVGHFRPRQVSTNFCSGDFRFDNGSPLSFTGAILAVFVRGFDSNAAARQCLAKKNFDFGIDASQVRRGAALYGFENRFLGPKWKGNTFGSGWPASL